MDDCPAGVVVVFAPSFSAMDPAGQRARTCGLMYSTRSKLYARFKLYTVLIFTIHLNKHYISIYNKNYESRFAKMIYKRKE